jgi:hypothetical protein
MEEGDIYRARSIIGPDRLADHAGGPARHHPGCFWKGLDYRRQPVYAGSRRSVAFRLPAFGYMAAH